MCLLWDLAWPSLSAAEVKELVPDIVREKVLQLAGDQLSLSKVGRGSDSRAVLGSGIRIR